MKTFSKKTNEEIYLEYVNDWLTLESMADNYGRKDKELETIINKGKKEHLQKFATK